MSKNSHNKHEHKQAHKHKVDMQSAEVPHEDYRAGLGGDIVIFILIIGLGLFFVLPFYGLLPNPGNVMLIGLFILIVLGFVWLLVRRTKRRKK